MTTGRAVKDGSGALSAVPAAVAAVGGRRRIGEGLRRGTEDTGSNERCGRYDSSYALHAALPLSLKNILSVPAPPYALGQGVQEVRKSREELPPRFASSRVIMAP